VKRETSGGKRPDPGRDTLHASRDGEASDLDRLMQQQQAWEAFAACAIQMIPVLIKQMDTVTQETERAAMELMVHLRAMTQSNEASRFNDASSHLSKVLMAMQFQDITRQQLEHVGQALDYWRTHLQDLLKGPQDEGARKEIAVLQRLEQSYTMEAERRLHAAAIAPDYHGPVPAQTEQNDREPGSVTLF